ncbi:MAG: SIMPL domain-containing protein [Marinicella sp.]
MLILTPLAVWAQNNEHTITVQGVGQITIDNSTAFISAQVSTQNLDAEQALTHNNNIVHQVFNELNGVGINEEHITTTNFSFQPNYDWQEQGYVFTGYVVTNSIRVEVNEMQAVGSILNLLVDSGVSRINSVSFDGTEMADLRQQALVQATQDARTKAEILANATGVTLGAVININLFSGSNMYTGDVSPPSSGASSPRPVPISGGSNTITETVNITYLIDD